MEVVEPSGGMTIPDLNEQEQELTQRRDAYVQEANSNVAAFNGAIQQVQAQRAILVRRHEAAVAAAQAEQDKGKTPRRARTARKTPVAAPA